jgi:Sec-independent protein translocase protein TatA
MAFAPIIAPLAVGAGALIGKTATRSVAANTRGAKRQMNDVRAENYRQAMRHQLKQKAPKQPKISKGGNGSETVAGQPAGGAPAGPATQREARPDTGGPAGGAGSAAPATEQMPII